MAASVMILGLTFRNNLKMMLLCAVLAASLHKSMMLLAAAGACAWFVTDTRYYWRDGWEYSGRHLGGTRHWGDDCLLRLFDDPRLTLYINQADGIEGVLPSVQQRGFPLGFLIYSALPIATGCYFLFRRSTGT